MMGNSTYDAPCNSWRLCHRIFTVLADFIPNCPRKYGMELFFLQAKDGIRAGHVTGVQTCALPIFIDYLQLLQPDGSYERRDLEVGAMTRELKQFALQHEVPVVLLSQLSRNVESRKNNRPILSDLRESGNIEQDADVVLFLHRDDYYGGSRCEVSDMDVIVAKHRNGPTGSVAVRFDRECGRFEGVS